MLASPLLQVFRKIKCVPFSDALVFTVALLSARSDTVVMYLRKRGNRMYMLCVITEVQQGFPKVNALGRSDLV